MARALDEQVPIQGEVPVSEKGVSSLPRSGTRTAAAFVLFPGSTQHFVMSARGCIAIVALLLASRSSAVAAENSADSAIQWVRALAGHDTGQIVSSTRLPFVFRTTGRDRTCQGWVRSKKALLGWLTCVAKREDFRNLHALLGADGIDVRSGGASAGQAEMDDMALKIGGLHDWSQWRLVSVTHLWTTMSFRLLDRSADGKFLVGALIMDIRNSHD